MSREFRPLEDGERVAFQEMVDYAFDPRSGPTSYDGPEETPDRPGRPFGVFEDGDLRSVCSHYDFTARVREDWLPLVGLAAVATPPEFRRQGLVRTLVRESLQRWRGDYPFSALWPFEHAYYRQFGWAMANKTVRYTCPPSALGAAHGAPGRMRRVGPDDWERLQDVHEAHGAERGLTLRRDDEWWRTRVFRSIGGDRRYVYALERGDAVDGYVVYTFGSGEEGTRLRVSDVAFRDHDAYRRLLAFLADHDSQAEEVLLYKEEESELLDIVADPEAVDASLSPGPQVRIVDVAAALSALSYPADAEASVTLAVTDDHAPWNDGRFALEVADGAGTCRRVDGGEADAAVDVRMLSQVAVGTHSIATARRLGGLDTDDATATTLAEAFPPRTVSLREFF